MNLPPGHPSLRQRYYNRASQPNWQAFASHRRQITARLESLATAGDSSLCILGAGNCNDLDLAALTARWSRVTLVDIDAEAMRAGVANQFLTDSGRIELAVCDLTGALDLCHELAQSPTPEALARLRAALGQLPAAAQLGRQFTAVASTCVLSQLLGLFRRALGEENPELRHLTGLVRLQHLRTLAELTAPGGTAILFADVVSSESRPYLPTAPAGALPSILEQVIRDHGCFPGMNPHKIREAFTLPPLAGYWSGPPSLSPPWVWDLGPRSYLVTAITARRPPSAAIARPSLL